MSQVKSNLVFIDSNLKDTDVLLSSLNDETVGIVYHYDTSRNDILEQIKSYFASNQITRLAIACHEGERRFLEGQRFFDVSYNEVISGAEPDDLEPEIISEYSGLIHNTNTQFILDLLTTYNVSNIDFLACKSLKYQMWKDYYALIESQAQGVVVGASEDDTGNLKYGGDWVLENTGEQVDAIYFGEGLKNYQHLLQSFDAVLSTNTLLADVDASLTVTFDTPLSVWNNEYVTIDPSYAATLVGTMTSDDGGTVWTGTLRRNEGINLLDNTLTVTVGDISEELTFDVLERSDIGFNGPTTVNIDLSATVVGTEWSDVVTSVSGNGSLGILSYRNMSHIFVMKKIKFPELGDDDTYPSGCLFEYGGSGDGMYIGIVNDKFIFGAGDGSYGTLSAAAAASNTALIQIDMTSNLIPKDDEEHEIAAYFDSSRNKISLYIDGIKVGDDIGNAINNIAGGDLGGFLQFNSSIPNYVSLNNWSSRNSNNNETFDHYYPVTDLAINEFIGKDSITNEELKNSLIIKSGSGTIVDVTGYGLSRTINTEGAKNLVLDLSYNINGDIVNRELSIEGSYIEPQVISITLDPSNIIFPDTSANFEINFSTQQDSIHGTVSIDPSNVGELSNMSLTNNRFRLSGTITSLEDSTSTLLKYYESDDVSGVSQSFEILVEETFEVTSFTIGDIMYSDLSSNVEIRFGSDYFNGMESSMNLVSSHSDIISFNMNAIENRIWTGTVSAPVNTDIPDAYLRLTHNGTSADGTNVSIDISQSFVIDNTPANLTITSDPSSITFPNDSSEIQFAFNRYDLSGSDICMNYVTITPADYSSNLVSYGVTQGKIWSGKLDLSGIEYSGTIDISYNDTLRSNSLTIQVNTTAPVLTDAVLSSNTLLSDVDASLIVIFQDPINPDTNVNEYVTIDPSYVATLVGTMTSDDGGTVWTGILRRNEGINLLDNTLTVTVGDITKEVKFGVVESDSLLVTPTDWIQMGIDIDGEALDDYSGYSVSLSSDGKKVAIGAPYNDGNGINLGHVRVYEWNDISWNKIGSDIDGEAGADQSGYSVSLSGDGKKVAIGARFNDGNGTDSGHVRVYEWNDISWNKIGQDIDGEAGTDYSGYSVSLSSDGLTVAIGAILNDGNDSSSGHVRVYEWNKDDTSWNKMGPDIDGEAGSDQSGYSVSLSSDGKKVAIGAKNNDGNGTDSGHVRIFQWNKDDTIWDKMGPDIDGEAVDDRSGPVSLSSDGKKVAIGAPFNDGNDSNSGHVRVYEWNDTSWDKMGPDIDGEASNDRSGYSVSLSSDGLTVAIGAYLNDGNGNDSGRVRIYKWNKDDSSWNKIGQDIDGEAVGDQSGYSVSLSSDGKKVAIGTPYNDGNDSNSGHVRVYHLDPYIEPKVISITLDPSNIIFPDTSANFEINFATQQDSIQGTVSIDPSNVAELSNMSLTNNGFTLSGTIIATSNSDTTKLKYYETNDVSGESVNFTITLNNIPNIISFGLSESIISYEHKNIELQFQFDEIILQEDVSITSTSSNIILGNLDSSVNNTWTMPITANYNLVETDVSININYNDNNYTLPLQIDTTIPDISGNMIVENILYSDRESRIEINFNHDYFNGKQDILDFQFVLDPSENLTLNMGTIDNRQWTGTINITAAIYNPSVSLQLDFTSDDELIQINEIATFDIDTRVRSLSMILLEDVDYKDNTGRVQLEFSLTDYSGTDVSMNHFNITPDDTNITFTSLGVINGALWEGELEITGEILRTIQIEYKEELIPERDDQVVEYREATIEINIDTMVPDPQIFKLDKNEYSYLDNTINFEIEFDKALIQETNISSFISIVPTLSSHLTLSDVTLKTGNIWTGSISISGEIQNQDIIANIRYYGKEIDTSFNIDTQYPKVQSVTLNQSTITFDSTSSQVIVVFDKNVIEEDISSMISVLTASGEELLGQSVSLTSMTKVDPGNQWEFILNVSSYGVIESNVKLQIEHYGTTYDELFNINTLVPDISSMTLSNDLIAPNTTATLTVTFNNNYFDTVNILPYFSLIPSIDATLTPVDSSVNLNSWHGQLSTTTENMYRLNNIIQYNFKHSTNPIDISNSITYNIDTLDPYVLSATIDIQHFSYTNSITTLTILFTKNINDTSSQLSDYIIINPSEALEMTNLSKSQEIPTKWTATITALTDYSFPNLTSYIEVNYKGTIARTQNFNIDTVSPTLELVNMDVTEFHYNQTTANISMKFSRELVETSYEFQERHMTIIPSDSLIVTSLSHNCEDETIWNGVISVSGELQYENASITIDYKGVTFPFNNLNIDTIVPVLVDISMDIPNFTYNELTANLLIEFTRDLVETSIELENNNIVIEPNGSLILSDLQKNENPLFWNAILSINEGIENSDGLVQMNYKGITKEINSFGIDTIVPELTFVQLSVDNFTYLDTSAILTFGFTRNIVETSEELIANNITIHANGKLEISNLQKNENPFLWSAILSVEGQQRESACKVSIHYKGKTIDTPEFEIDTDSLGIREIALDIDHFTYNNKTSNVTFKFSGNVLDTPEALENANIFIEPSNSLIMTNLQKSTQDEEYWNALLEIIGEVEYENASIRVDYQGTQVIKTFNIDTIIPDVSFVEIDITKFTYLDTTANLTIGFTRNVIDDVTFLINNSITIQPSNDLTITGLQKDTENPLLWNGIISVNKEVETFNGIISVSYKTTTRNTPFFDIDTIVPDVRSIIMVIPEINYYENGQNIMIEFSRNVLDTSFNLQSNHIYTTPSDSLIMTHLEQNVENPLIWNAILSVSGEIYDENASVNVSYRGTSNTLNNIKLDTELPELLDLQIDKSSFDYHITTANVTIEFSRNLVESSSIIKEHYITLYPHESLRIDNLVQSYTNNKHIWSGILRVTDEIEDPSVNIAIQYNGITKQTPFITTDTIIPDVLSVTMDNSNFTYYDTSRNITIEFSRNVLETSSDLQEKYITIDPSESLLLTNFQQNGSNPLIWNGVLNIDGEVDKSNASIIVEYKGTSKTISDINIDTFTPILYLLEMNPNKLTYNEPSQVVNIYFTRNVLDSEDYFLTNYVSFEPNESIVINQIEKSRFDNKIWNVTISISGELDSTVGEFKMDFNGIVKTINFPIDTIMPTIESMTMTRNNFIIDKVNATNNIANDIPIAEIEIKFARKISETTINKFLKVRDKNLQDIPTHDISLSTFTTNDEGITWTGTMTILQYQLYYYNSSILMDYVSSYRSIQFNVDTVKDYTYSNKLVGPRNETVIAYFKPCYEIKRTRGKTYYVFDNNITNESCSIFGINEKTYQNISNTKISIGYNSNYELYNNGLTTIASNGLVNIGLGDINSDVYNFTLKSGFITYSLTNVVYSDSLLSIIKDVLEIWTTKIDKPLESKFKNVNDYNNYSLSISFIITDLEEYMTSEIVSSYGTNFGSIFPISSKVRISKSYMEGKLNSNGDEITNSNHINSIQNYLKRSIGNALGIGHYWYLPTSPISYDVLNNKYYSGSNGVNKYIQLYSTHPKFNNRLFGLPIEDYNENSIFMEEGNNQPFSNEITLNGFTHPGLDKEVMTKWIDFNTIIPVSIVSFGLLEDIGYDVCYNNVDAYNPGDIFANDYEIHLVSDPSINMFERLTNIYIQLKNKFYIKMLNGEDSTQEHLNKIFTDYVSTVINNSVSMPINELIVTHKGNLEANWSSFNDVNGLNVEILQNIENETSIIESDIRVYKLTTIRHENDSITAILDKQINK